MSVIRNLEAECDGIFLNGKFDSTSLFPGEMSVTIYAEDGATEADALRCINHYNALSVKEDLLNQLQHGLEKFFLYMCNEWKDFGGMYGDILETLEPVLDGYKQGTPLVTYLYDPTLYVFPQQENEIGYGIECECPWEPEHQCSILIRNDRVVYVGPSEGLGPWCEEDEYYCVWNEGE